MTVNIYKSNDASAPTLNGTAGSLVNVLYACLVTGYGSKGAAGWAREFTGTNKAAFRASSGNRFRLLVDDTGTQEARLVAYETMTDVDTGTNPFPTTAQLSGGIFCRKSNTADATTRAWMVVASDVMVYVFIDSGSASTDWSAAPTAANLSGCFGFGDFVSYKSGDTYNTIIFGAVATSTSVGQMANKSQQNGFTSISGHWVARPYTGVAGSAVCAKCGILSQNTGSVIGVSSSWGPYPDPITGGLLVSPLGVAEAGASGFLLRGVLPGLWEPMHNLPANHADTFSGSGVTAGKTFLLANASFSTTLGRVAVETSNTW